MYVYLQVLVAALGRYCVCLEAKREDYRSREGWSRWMKVTVSFGFWKRSSVVKNVEHSRKAFTFGWIDFWPIVFRPWEI